MAHVAPMLERIPPGVKAPRGRSLGCSRRFAPYAGSYVCSLMRWRKP